MRPARPAARRRSWANELLGFELGHFGEREHICVHPVRCSSVYVEPDLALPTEDLDFVASPGHMELLFSNPYAMRQYHFDPACTWKLYHDTGVEVDLWKDEHADAIISRSREVELAGRKLRIADPHDLVAMKLRAGRLQDDYDVSEILRATPLDEPTLRSRVTPEQFAHFESIKARSR